MLRSPHSDDATDDPPRVNRHRKARSALSVASLVAVLLIGAGTVGCVWRYEVALGNADTALSARAEALQAEAAATAFWREREVMNEYLLDPAPALLTELTRARAAFDAATRHLGDTRLERELILLSRTGNATFLKVFDENRGSADQGRSAELALVERLNAAEPAVLQPLASLHRIYLHEVQQRRAARSASDFQALVAAVLSGLIACAATAGLAVYSRRLLRGVQARRLREQTATTSQYEYSEMLQAAESEEEADQLLKRQLERSVPASAVVVMRRNNSADRLLATTQADAVLAERLAGAEPRSCLAVRFGRTHEQGEGTEPLMGCALCSQDSGASTCQPLLVGGEVLGAALVRHSAALSGDEQRAVIAAVGQAGPVLANLRNLSLARFRAATDALTGLPNSREVQDTLKRMTAHASRTLSPLAALLLDLDHFKEINDTDGHAAGDDVLAALGTTVRATLRASDFVGRYGGEEFVILLPDTGYDEALIAAEKIRAAVEAITVSGVSRPITASIGLAVLPDNANNSVSLLRHADRCLYSAKSNGRNRVAAVPRADAARSADLAREGVS